MSGPRRVAGSGAADALLFDLDGTLADNFTGIARSIVYALDQLGVETPSAGELRRFVGPPLRATARAASASGIPS